MKRKRARARTVYLERPTFARVDSGAGWALPIVALGALGIGGVYLYYAYTNCKWPFDGSLMECGSNNECAENAVRCDTTRTPNVSQKCIGGVWTDDPTGTTCTNPPPASATQTFKTVYRATGAPTPGVEIYYNGTTVITNASGIAVFSDVPAGTQTATFYKPDWHIDDFGIHMIDSLSVYRPSDDDYTFRTVEMEWAKLPDATLSTFKANGSPTGCVIIGASGDAACKLGACCSHPPCKLEVVVRNRWGEPIPNARVYQLSYDNGNQMCYSLLEPQGSTTCDIKKGRPEKLSIQN